MPRRRPDPSGRSGAVTTAMTAVLLLVAAVLVGAAWLLWPLRRIVRGDPLDAGWRLATDPPALILELEAVGGSRPVRLDTIAVDADLARRLALEPPAGFRPATGQPADDVVTFVGRQVVEAGGTAEIVLPAPGRAAFPGGGPGERRARAGAPSPGRSAAAAGRIILGYGYPSVLSPMTSSAFLDVVVPAAGERDSPGPGSAA